MSAKKKKYMIVTPSESEFLETIRDFISKIANCVGFTEESINKIQLAVDEACTNVINHAYDEMTNNDLRVEAKVADDKLDVSVIDYGKGFEPHIIKSPNMRKYLKGYKRGGLGIHLIKKLMDDVTFSVTPFKKNQITMTIYKDPETEGYYPLEENESESEQNFCLMAG